jgi:tetratricopeptide (TPR) repeat protein
MRKSIQIAPGVRLTASKSGIGYSVGTKGYRVTKHANGRVSRTASLPGTGLSHNSTVRAAPSRRTAAPRGQTKPSPAPPPEAPRPMAPPKPGMLASKGEKELFAAYKSGDADAIERVATAHPEAAYPAAVLAGILKLSRPDQQDRSLQLLAWAFSTGAAPESDPFISRYVGIRFELGITDGFRAELGVTRDAIGLALAELYQARDDLGNAIAAVEQLQPTTVAAISLADLYLDAGQPAKAVDLTNGISNQDDTTALLCMLRGVALRDLAQYTAAREAFKEALKSKQRDQVIRHRSLYERSRTYELEGKRAMARKDLERILAEDSSYPWLLDAIAALS